ncbi:hypothetical protein MIR68_000303 [Amoeboaphelidium protococcarum]|nr:hypothetical protein MIR68_000303 [Amoeboaphelidium protococcarum]KAI3652408.1 hypothetical protein MP228_002733 [Amoeboaphelidium protococcarum]
MLKQIQRVVNVRLLHNESSLQTISPKILKRDDPLVQKLFRAYIPQDFEPQGVDKNGKEIPPLVSQQELKQLRVQCYRFGLRPQDLNLPELKEQETTEVNDLRLSVMRARAESLIFERQERAREKLAKQHRRELRQRKITMQDVEKDVRELEEKFADPEKYKMPLSLMTMAERAEYERKKLSFIENNMKAMDQKLQEWKIKKREARKQIHDKQSPI